MYRVYEIYFEDLPGVPQTRQISRPRSPAARRRTSQREEMSGAERDGLAS